MKELIFVVDLVVLMNYININTLITIYATTVKMKDKLDLESDRRIKSGDVGGWYLVRLLFLFIGTEGNHAKEWEQTSSGHQTGEEGQSTILGVECRW